MEIDTTNTGKSIGLFYLEQGTLSGFGGVRPSACEGKIELEIVFVYDVFQVYWVI